MLKISREELEVVKQAARRLERRSNSRFVLDQTRVEITDEACPLGQDLEELKLKSS